MQKYNVSILPSAQDEIEAAIDFIAQNASVATALLWRNLVLERARTLTEFPQRYPIAEEGAFFEEEIRVLIVGSYRLLYRIVGNEVQALHVRHGARQRETAD